MRTHARISIAALALTLGAGVLAGAIAGRGGQPTDPAQAGGGPSIDDLAFLEGRWVCEFEGGRMEEVWLAPDSGNITGTLRQIVDGAVNMVEVFTVTAEEDGRLVMRLRHFDGALQPWKSEREGPLVGVFEEASDGRAVVRAVERSGTLERILYERTGEDTFVATLSFAPSSGREQFVLEFKRR